jgi:hypothetical protein
MNLDTRAASARRRCEGALAAGSETVEDALDVLARTEAIQPKIVAAASVVTAFQGTDLNDIVVTAVRSNPIGAEERLLRLEGVDIDDLGLASPPPTIDLVGVGAQPALERRPLLNNAARRLGASGVPASGGSLDRLAIGRPYGIGFMCLGMI